VKFLLLNVVPPAVVTAIFPVLAPAGLARAYALQARSSSSDSLAAAQAKARSGYQDFFNLWNGADSDIPELKKAKAEFTAI
jgi:eukaryotic-like serine/threonine-protein kinase